MAQIQPFCAVRPEQKYASRIAALPYDVYDRNEALAEVTREPLSFLHIDRPETWFDSSVDIYDDQVYEKASQVLSQWLAEGYFVREDKKCFYIYQQVMDGRSQTGIVACASVDDYTGNVIKKHENTREDKELDRIRHIRACKAQTGPIFLAYRANEVIRGIVKKYCAMVPVYDFASQDGTIQRVWVVDDDDNIDEISRAFETISDIYIADGHHRAASAVKVSLEMRRERALAGNCKTGHPNDFADGSCSAESDYFMSVLFPDEDLKILPYNRVARDLNGLTKDEFLKAVNEKFHVAVLDNFDIVAREGNFPDKKACFGMYLDHQWYELSVKPEILSDDAVDGLDVSILQDHLLAPVLGIHDPRTNQRIDFIGGIRGLGELVKRCDTQGFAVAFAMFATSIDELFAVADANRLMPPKSTWFEPKLYSGLFIHELV